MDYPQVELVNWSTIQARFGSWYVSKTHNLIIDRLRMRNGNGTVNGTEQILFGHNGTEYHHFYASYCMYVFWTTGLWITGDLALCIDDVQSILDYMMKEENLPEKGEYM